MLLRKFHDIESKAFSKSINKNKPGISFSSAYRGSVVPCENWNLSWGKTTFTVLGINFDVDISKITKINYEKY
jgi:hypothetical protein